MSDVTTESRIAFQFDRFRSLPLRHAMSGRIPEAPADGDLGHGPNTVDVTIEANRRAFIEAARCSMSDLVISRQTHGTRVEIVSAEHRGRGLSKWLMEAILSHPELQGLRRWMLVTRDAHGLYRQFGFTDAAGTRILMEIVRPDPYRMPASA